MMHGFHAALVEPVDAAVELLEIVFVRATVYAVRITGPRSGVEFPFDNGFLRFVSKERPDSEEESGFAGKLPQSRSDRQELVSTGGRDTGYQRNGHGCQ